MGKRRWGVTRHLMMAALSALLASSCLFAGEGKAGGLALGIQGGWAAGLGSEFGQHDWGRAHFSLILGPHLGGYLQYAAAGGFGLQFAVNLQLGNESTMYQSGSKEETPFSFSSFSLNAAWENAKKRKARFYLLAGAGLAIGGKHMPYFNGAFVVFNAGTGVKIQVNRQGTSAIVLGGAYQHLWDPKNFYDDHGGLLRFSVGLEFLLVAGGKPQKRRNLYF